MRITQLVDSFARTLFIKEKTERTDGFFWVGQKFWFNSRLALGRVWLSTATFCISTPGGPQTRHNLVCQFTLATLLICHLELPLDQ